MTALLTEHQIDLERKPRVRLEDYPDELHEAISHAHGSDDRVFAAIPNPRLLVPDPEALTAAQEFWLPEGNHFGLHVEHRPLENAGPFTGGGNKWVWHITVSGWNTVDAMFGVLRDKRAAPHLIIGGRSGVVRPVVIQCIPFNFAGRALEHPSGPETNRANALQVEVCANVADVPAFSDTQYKAFANLVRLTNRTLPQSRCVPRELARRFADTSRMGGQEFVDASGHCGHMHVPQNSHTDPTNHFDGKRLLKLLQEMPDNGYVL